MPRLMLVNGRIRTLDPNVGENTAVVCENGRISAVCDDFSARSLFQYGDEVVDLEGRTVLPAFHDAHTHFFHFALSLRRLRFDDSHSEGAVCTAIRGSAERAQPGEWIVGRGWSLGRWHTDEWPTKASLDEAAPNNPVALAARDGHSWWVNSKALEAAKIVKGTPDPQGGVIVRDASGEPTGILKEKALEILKPFVTFPSEKTMLGGLRDATDIFHSNGIAAADVMAGAMGRDLELEEAFRIFQKLEREGKLGIRLTIYFPAHDLDKLIGLGIRSGFGSDWLRIGGIKIYADGSLGSRTASMLEPYTCDHGKDHGVDVTPGPELTAIIQKAADHGLASAVHAIGDKAVRNTLDAFAHAQSSTAAHGLRQRIEHAQCIATEDVKRFADIGVIASVQPCQLMGDIETSEKCWGKERSKRVYPLRSLLAAGATIAMGTDVPIEPPDPRRSLKGAVLRPMEDGSMWNPDECIDSWDAITGYTKGSAYAAGVDDRAGTIGPGRRADLMVFSEDPIDIGVKRMADATVILTVVDGKVVYRKK